MPSPLGCGFIAGWDFLERVGGGSGRLLDEAGGEIFVRYKGEPSKERYEFIRDYLDFKVKRMK